VAAATELKEQYNNTRTRGAVLDMSDAQFSIPGAFPQVSIVTKGEEQMVLFPTYAKRHVREFGGNPGRFPPGQHSFQAANAAQMGVSEEQYWKQEWARMEDEKAVADVDVRGWIYMPSKGPMTRRNRMLIGLARRLSGIPTPNTQPGPEFSPHEDHQKMKEEQRIAREAREIERRGQGEEEVAERGGYSEFPSGPEAAAGFDPVGKTHAPVSPPPSPTLSARTPTMQQQSDLTDAELAVANANLMARIGPFMTTPLVQIPVTMFFYNDEQSRSHTVMTDDSGHFITRIALEFVPTHVRVLANEDLSATKPIEIIEDRGVSLISDIDDTVKRSNISLGAREIFRNTFVRELADLTIEGVREWYGRMHDLGVKIHYCSNSPWQLFPVLATFFHTAGLPHGSIHLKQYSGMLQGIFEPVAERKKGTLEAILRDFPERKFLLVGDSGEADLEVYTELVVANPGRILAVFIRDVTTPDQAGFFDSSFTMGTPRSNTVSSRTKPEDHSTRDEPKSKPQLPPRAPAPPPASTGPIMGTLIDFSDEPAQISPGETPANEVKPENPVRKAPPPRPAKPAALRSASSDASSGSQKQRPSPALNPRLEDLSMADDSLRPLQRAQTQSTVASSNSARPAPPPPPPPRRRGTPLLAQQQQQSREDSNPNPDVTEMDASLPPASGSSGSFPVQAAAAASAMSETAAGAASYGPAGTAAVNKKVDLWLRRLARAHEILDAHGVKLYTWRRGDEVTAEAEGIVREALGRIEVDGRERGDRKGL
jgi:phosphatidate phosphatase APP1